MLTATAPLPDFCTCWLVSVSCFPVPATRYAVARYPLPVTRYPLTATRYALRVTRSSYLHERHTVRIIDLAPIRFHPRFTRPLVAALDQLDRVTPLLVAEHLW